MQIKTKTKMPAIFHLLLRGREDVSGAYVPAFMADFDCRLLVCKGQFARVFLQKAARKLASPQSASMIFKCST